MWAVGPPHPRSTGPSDRGIVGPQNHVVRTLRAYPQDLKTGTDSSWLRDLEQVTEPL